MSLPRVKMAEANDDSVVVSESGNTKETISYPSTSCEDIESSHGSDFDTGVLTLLSRLKRPAASDLAGKEAEAGTLHGYFNLTNQLQLNDIMSPPH